MTLATVDDATVLHLVSKQLPQQEFYYAHNNVLHCQGFLAETSTTIAPNKTTRALQPRPTAQETRSKVLRRRARRPPLPPRAGARPRGTRAPVRRPAGDGTAAAGRAERRAEACTGRGARTAAPSPGRAEPLPRGTMRHPGHAAGDSGSSSSHQPPPAPRSAPVRQPPAPSHRAPALTRACASASRGGGAAHAPRSRGGASSPGRRGRSCRRRRPRPGPPPALLTGSAVPARPAGDSRLQRALSHDSGGGRRGGRAGLNRGCPRPRPGVRRLCTATMRPEGPLCPRTNPAGRGGTGRDESVAHRNCLKTP